MIQIRKATTADAAAIAETGRISFLESHGDSASAADIEAYTSGKYTQQAIVKELENPDNIYHLMSYNNKVAGYSKIILDATHDQVTAQHTTCMDRLYLLKEFYDLKLGWQLLAYNIELSRQAHQAGMWLYTWVENKRAVAFYQRAGFKIVGAADFRISDTHSNPNHIMYLDYSTL